MDYQQALNILINVILYSLAVAAPLIMLIIVMYQYEKYSKWRAKEQKEADRIIVKMNEDIVNTSKTINHLKDQEAALEKKIKEYEERKVLLQDEIGVVEKATPEESKPLDQMNIKELHAVARERGIKGFSRMSKDELLKALGA
jgi:septal ring factor EnvC (AmiA/AmiB activator)